LPRTNTLTYYQNPLITAVKSFKVQALGVNVIKHFAHSNLQPFHGNTVILAHRGILILVITVSGSKCPWYGLITSAPDETIRNTAVIYSHILTLEREVTIVNYSGIFITLAPGH
jgi:hypothetical protein